MVVNGWRTVTQGDLASLITPEEYDNILHLLKCLDPHYHTLLEALDHDITTILQLDCLTSRGSFRDYILHHYGTPYHTWDMPGNKAKYYRILIEQARHAIFSLKDRIALSTICEKYDYDLDNDNIIRDIQEQGIPYTTGTLRNICRNKTVPTLNTESCVILDFTTEDNQLSTVNVQDKSVTYKVNICRDWIHMTIPLPYYMRLCTGKIARPIIQRDKDTEALYVRVCYEIPEMVMTTTKDTTGVLSCDIGIVKPFSAVITYEDGSYTTELAPSKEAIRLRHKMSVLEKESNLIWIKASHNEKLLSRKEDKYLRRHTEDQYEQRHHIRHTISLLKEHYSWVIARDICSHAITHGVNTIKMEDLAWLDSTAGKWAFSDLLTKLLQVAELYGITILLVNAHDSSHTDPFTKQRVHPNEKREVATSAGVLDRDNCAALELGTRYGRGVTKSKIRDRDKKNKRVLIPGKTRDKHHSTPKRPKLPRRKILHKRIVKKNISVSYCDCIPGVSITVASSGAASPRVLHNPTSTGIMNNISTL